MYTEEVYCEVNGGHVINTFSNEVVSIDILDRLTIHIFSSKLFITRVRRKMCKMSFLCIFMFINKWMSWRAPLRFVGESSLVPIPRAKN